MSVPPSPRVSARGPTPPSSPAMISTHRSVQSSSSSSSSQSRAHTHAHTSSQQQAAAIPSSPSNSEVELPFSVRPGDRLANRYEVIGLIGRGTFSSVLACRALNPFPGIAYGVRFTNPYLPSSLEISNRDQIVAVKVVRDVERYRRAAEREIVLLDMMKRQPNSHESGCIELLDYFLWCNRYVCMVFPLHGSSLYDFLYRNRFLPFFPAHIQHVAKQICKTLAYLHDLNIVHADLKPENILLMDSSYQTVNIEHLTVNVPMNTHIKFVDFGTAVLDSTPHKPKIVASRSYRALEVIFEIGWSFGVDIWAAGCVLMELYSGTRLFNLTNSSTDLDHLRMMEAILGPIPKELQKKSPTYCNEVISPLSSSSPLYVPTSSSPPSSNGMTMNSSLLLSLADHQMGMDSDESIDSDSSPMNTNRRLSDKQRKMSMSSSTSTSTTSNDSTPRSSAPSSPRLNSSAHFEKRVSMSNHSSPSLSSSSSPSSCPRLIDRIVHTDELFYDLVSKMLTYDQTKRITAKQALEHPYFRS